MPRSEIIQNLSIFIRALGWVRPSEGNHTLCKSNHVQISRLPADHHTDSHQVLAGVK